jgi:hypothetical protein
MKYIFTIVTILLFSSVFSQSFNEDKTAFTNYVKRMYASAPFDGVKIIEDYDHQYLVSVMNRVAQVKAQSQVNTYLNGASIDMNTIIRTTETTENNQTKSVTESIEQIKQNSTGFSQGLELLTNFENSDSKKMVYVYMREIKK